MSVRIEDYALIGDCETAALVSREGSIDWLCWPRFDSPACFSAILGGPEHGRWLLRPKSPQAVATRAYRDHQLVLETRWETPEGVVRVVDFMPPRTGGSNLIRKVVGERGRVVMGMELVIRFGYGAYVPWVTRLGDGALRAVAGPDQLVLRAPMKLHGEGASTVGEIAVAEGDVVHFTLNHSPSHHPPPEETDPEEGLVDTEQFWSEWGARAKIVDGPYRDIVMRSLLVLKALTYAPTGGIVAAPTTSLPETLGGIRNWDYRYCWLRDATLSLLALMNAGFYDEAAAWRDWLLRAVAGTPEQAQIMYGIDGERRLVEWEVDWLPGYEGARPVRIGNDAHDQLQLDVYGEVLDALYQAHRGGVASSTDGWAVQRALLSCLENKWSSPDRGIWESRGEPRHYTFSKIMAWVAFDRGIKLATEAGLDGPLDRWRAVAARIHEDVCAKGFDPELGSFVQAYGTKLLDGSLLLIPTTGFLPVDDPRVVGTVQAVQGRLLEGGFVMRHDPAEVETGLAHGEGAFLACTFWLADALVMLGRREEGKAIFERTIALANDVGLLSEGYEVREGRLVGNFPQAFSHVALVNTAHNLSQRDKPAEQRAGSAAVRTQSP